jgi:glycerophosphoryl diester phosphodiesterase
MMIIQHRAQDSTFNAQADCAEVDVMMTSDGQVVCRHDHLFEDKEVWSQPYKPEMGPLFRDFVDSYSGRLIVETKLPELHWQGGQKDFEMAVLEIAPKDAMFCSFSAAGLHKLRLMRHDATLIANFHSTEEPNVLLLITDNIEAFAVRLSDYKFFKERYEIPIFVFTVNDPDELNVQHRRELAGVFTDHPERWR